MNVVSSLEYIGASCQNKGNIKELIMQPFESHAVNPLFQYCHLKRPPALGVVSIVET